MEIEDSQRSIWRARDGDPSLLAERLRKGVASKHELLVASLFLDGRFKLHHRPEQYARGLSTMEQEIALMRFLGWVTAQYPDWQRKKVVGYVCDAFDLKKSAFYKIEKKYRERFPTLALPRI